MYGVLPFSPCTVFGSVLSANVYSVYTCIIICYHNCQANFES